MACESHELTFAKDFSSSRFVLLEAPDESFLNQIKKGAKFCFKGKNGDEAVLCSETTTFAVRMVETSNTVLLVEQSLGVGQIVGSSSNYLELSEITPKVSILESLLSEGYFRGISADKETQKNLYSWSELSAIVQASDYQLKKALKELNAFELNGFWRLVDPAYMNEILEYMLTEAVAKDWDISNLSQEACLRSLVDFDTLCVLHCLEVYSQENNHYTEINGDKMWHLDAFKISLFRAKQLLQLTSRSWALEAFLAEWKDTVPQGVPTGVEMLKGVAVVTTDLKSSMIQYLPTSSLPRDPRQRFRALFTTKKNWALDEIMPYLQDVTPPGMGAEQFLLKYARAHHTPQGTIYSSREL